VFIALTNLGIFFLMLLGGVEMRASDLAQASAKAFVVALCGLVLPVIVGFWVSWAFLPDSDVKFAQCLFVGTALAITGGFLAPIFFASIGMHMDISAVTTTPGFVLLLIVVAFLTKLIGAGIPAYLLGFSKLDAWAVGIGMSGRGAVELIIAEIALRAGLFSYPNPPPLIVSNLFSAIVIVAVVTTLATPLALRAVFGRTKTPQGYQQ
jgi:Kef-type K+ transport system membrane component KefB